ncbi:TrbC/VirB2 family protein [Caulobacter sp. DWR1-3-2b1]|uniref:TrbC/VirB2 family protein n=1 Tax=Caulobacter sp. DWR1-3-2b1 TaxID=2804670 RepID=UPI003CE83FEC
MRKFFYPRPAVLASILSAAASQAHAQAIQADPQGSGALLAGVQWLQGTLLGNVATVAAVMAVAAVGFMMLTGRMNWRYGATVILGCFILFGATTIVSGIRTAAGGAI